MTRSATDLDGALRLDGDRVAVRFERRYATTPADLWQAVTDPARLARWFAPVSGDLHPTGAYRVDFGDGQEATGVVRECDPPREFVATWDFPGEPTSLLTIRITPADDAEPADPVAGDPVAGDPVAGDPVAGDPVAGDPVAGDPVARTRAAVLVLDHVRLPVDQGAGYGAGWHAYLDALEADLGGREPQDWDARFAALVGPYRARTPAPGPGD